MNNVTDRVRFLGRIARRDGVAYLGNTGTGFEFETDASRVTALMTTKASACKSDDKAAFIGVYINGSETPFKTVKLDFPEKEYLLYEGDGTPVKIRVFKLTEAAQAFVGVKGIYADGDVSPSKPREKRIEFIGDSLTCGYGNTAESPNEGFRTCTENGYEAYAAVLARMLDADLNVVASSGIGLYSSWTDKDEINDGFLMRDIYPYENLYIDERLKNDPKTWDFTSFEPDLAVLFLGTNDSTYIEYDPDVRIGEFKAEYGAFTEYVRRKNPDAHILCVYSSLKGKALDHRMYAAIEEVCSERNFAGDRRISAFMLPPVDTETEGLGAQEHPTVLTHRRFAKELYRHIKEKNIM